MGVPSLWRYLEDHRLLRHLGKGSDSLECNHLFIDMNSVMHGCYNPKLPTRKDTLDNVMATLERVLAKLTPSDSVTFAFDGVAPLAKLATQRDRRRTQLEGLTKKPVDLNQAMIVTGSIFVHECEEALILAIKGWMASKVISTTLPVYLSSFQAPGEGETKLTRRLLSIASEQLSKGTYTGADISVFVGTDSDLVLGCIGCTPFHNLFVMNPHTELLTDVGSLLTHWVNLPHGRFLPLDLLPSYRVDFVMCLTLAGCDFYKGLEEQALELWRQYRFLRLEGGFYRQQLLSTSDYKFNFDLLVGMFTKNRRKNKLIIEHFVGSQAKKQKMMAAMKKDDQSHGNAADAQTGVNLLNSSLWSLVTLIEGECPSFTKTFPPTAPKPSCIRIAATRCRQSVGVPRYQPITTSNVKDEAASSSVAGESSAQEMILPPISVFLGAIGRAKLCPQPFQDILSQEKHSRFHGLNAVSTIAPAIRAVIEEATANPEHAAKLKDPSVAPLVTLRPLHEYTTISADGTMSKVTLVSAYNGEEVEGPCVSVHSVGFRYPSYVTSVTISNSTYAVPQRKEKIDETQPSKAEEPCEEIPAEGAAQPAVASSQS